MTQSASAAGAPHVSALLTTPRSCFCGDVRSSHVGQTLLLKGWVHRRRDHGGLLFVDLRDRAGLVQIVFDSDLVGKDGLERAAALRDEFVIAVRGKVTPRSAETVNPKLGTGEIEIRAVEFEVLNPSEPTPFKLDDHQEINEEMRLRYRYLDLRRPALQRNFLLRHAATQSVRTFLSDNGFIEFETPILTKSTPEGARDFLVPSRLDPGNFYALPQSPQLFKQLLMVAGYDRYFQIARCFRDEDLRANRQPEFTQIDLEFSFITVNELIEVMEKLIVKLWKDTLAIEIPRPFRRISYAESMLKYGSDKPDLRFGLEISDVTETLKKGCTFGIFNGLFEKGGVVRAISVPGGSAKYSTTSLKPEGEFNKRVQAECGVKGVAWFKVAENGALESSIAKFWPAETLAELKDSVGAKPGDIIFMIADAIPRVAAEATGRLRLLLGRDNNLIPKDKWEFVWVLDFPMFDWNPEEKRWDPCHHPFTAPLWEDLHKLDSDPGNCRAQAYDLALNGEEIGGGSIRIHRRDIQEKVFTAIGIGEEEAKRKFGFLLEALSFGAPPHGGLAFGLDRLMMLILGEDSIRNVIPFPKTQTGMCIMTQCPSEVDSKQLRDLRLKIVVPPAQQAKEAAAAAANAAAKPEAPKA